MKKLSLSVLLLFAMMLWGLPGAVVSRVVARPPFFGSSKPVRSSGVQIAQDYRTQSHPAYTAPHASSGPQVTELQTIPPVPGVTFQIAGQQFVTGADGSAVIMVPQPGTYDLEVITDTFHDPYRQRRILALVKRNIRADPADPHAHQGSHRAGRLGHLRAAGREVRGPRRLAGQPSSA